MPYTKTYEELFLQFCIDGGVTGKGKKRTAPLYETVKVCHELWVELEVTPMLPVFLLNNSESRYMYFVTM